MKIKKIINSSFAFLSQQGFRKTAYSNGIEIEHHYAKSNIELIIIYGLGVPKENLQNIKSVQDILKNSKYTFQIIVQHASKRENLLDCTLFDKTALETLRVKLGVTTVENDIERIVDIYAKFIFNNINMLV